MSGKVGEAVLLLAFSGFGTLLPLALVHVVRARGGQLPASLARGRHKASPGAAYGATAGVSEESERPVNRGGELLGLLLSCGNAFAGGVMLATGLMHILGDALELSLRSAEGLPDTKEALLGPLAFCLIGILIPFALEKGGLAWWLLQHGACCSDHRANLHDADHQFSGWGEADLPSLSSSSAAASEGEVLVLLPSKARGLEHGYDLDHGHSHAGGEHGHSHGHSQSPRRRRSFDDSGCLSKCVVPSVSSTMLQGRLDFYRSVGSRSAVDYAPLVYLAGGQVEARETQQQEHTHPRRAHDGGLGEGAGGGGATVAPAVSPSSGMAVSTRGRRETAHDGKHVHPIKHSHMNFAMFLMFLVLSTHSLIVGFTIGTIRDSVGATQHTAYVAVALHKVFESIALGTQAAQSKMTNATVLELVIYNFAAPLGILLGSFSRGGIDRAAEADVMGLASGSFVYISLVEVLSEEFESEEYRIGKFACFAVGVAAMASLAHQT
jgi:zinc transporter ZupT